MNGDEASRPDGIAGGYCFSAPPPPPVSRSRGGRVTKVRKPKSGISVVGSGGGIGFMDRRGPPPPFWTVGNVEKGADTAAGIAGGSFGFGVDDDCIGTEKASSTSSSKFGEFGAGLKINDNVGGFLEVDDKKAVRETFVFRGSGVSPYNILHNKLDDRNTEVETENVRTSVVNRAEMPTFGENILPHLTSVMISQSQLDASGLGASRSTNSAPTASECAKSGTTVETETSSVEPASGRLDKQRNSGFHFSSTADGIEFKSASVKPSIFSAVDQKVEFTAKRQVAKSTVAKKKKDKMKIAPVQTRRAHFGKDYLLKDIHPSTLCFSPNLSPFPELFSANRISRESSLTSHESFELGTHSEHSDSRLSDSNDAIEEDLAVLTQNLALNEHGFKSQEILSDAPLRCDLNYAKTNIPEIESSSCNETRAFNAASKGPDAVDESSRSSVETLASSINGSLKINKMPKILFTSAGEATPQSKFTFGASVPAQEFAAAHVFNTRTQWKPGADSFSANLNMPYISSLTPLTAGTSLPSSPRTTRKGDLPYSHHILLYGSRVNDKGMCQNDASSVNAAALFAQELCEMWRLRGNRAYASEDFSRAEEYYTNGVNAIPQAEKSKTCHKDLVLCYSNRAASRMALGKVREALEDCLLAFTMDPNFFKAQLRAANCYLALGEVEDASHCFKKLLQSGADVVDHKTLVEASDGLQNAQRVSQCLNQCAKLPLGGENSDAEKLLRVIGEALLISPYCEKLLETKAEALFKLRKYKQVIQLCEHSLGSAEMNHSTLVADAKLTYQDDSLVSKCDYFRHWRYHFILRSFFQLGKLEQAVDLLDKEASREGNKMLESSIPLACTVRELERHKVAGNDAFQLGKYEVAVEHYSAALAKNLGSRPFAAICYCNRAAAQKALNQIADAISDCSLAIALDRNYMKAISRRASLFEVIRDYDQAAKDLRRLVSMLKAKLEEKKNMASTSDKSTNLSLKNELREAEVRLSEMQEEARKDIPVNLYLILGVESQASPTEIRKAYRKSALKHHPDKAGQIIGNFDAEDDALWKEMIDEVHRDTDRLFKMIGEAYAVLSDSTKRSHYDLNEAMKSAQSKGKGSSTPSKFPSHMFDRSSSGGQWTEMWRSYRQSQPQSQSQSQAQEANHSKWFAG